MLNKLRRFYILENILLVAIIVLAAFLRFNNFESRWKLAYDQAQFAITAEYAISNLKLPLLGPFSSGGPFQTGGEWYWVVMIGSLFPRDLVYSPWIFLTIICIASTPVMWLIGKKLFGVYGAFSASLIFAVSTAQIIQSTNLTNQTPIILVSAASLLLLLIYLRSKKMLYLSLASLTIGLGTSIHIQSVALFPTLLISILLTREKLIKSILVSVVMIAIPWIPVIIADSQNNFANTKNILLYPTFEQSKVPYEVLGRRWYTFVTTFLPSAFKEVSTGSLYFSYILIPIGLVFAAYKLLKKKLSKEWLLIYLSTFTSILILRYTRTPLFESFFVFFHPYMILITIYPLYYHNKFRYLGIILTIGISILLLINSYPHITQKMLSKQRNEEIYTIDLKRRYNGQKFSVYDLELKSVGQSLPLVLYLQKSNLISESGKKIGITVADTNSTVQNEYPIIKGVVGELQIYDLDTFTHQELTKKKWARINPKEIYNSTQYWYKLD